MKILFIDDERKRNEYLVSDLKEHYDIEIEWIREVKLVDVKLKNNFDAIILDIMIPYDDTLSTEEKKKANNGLATGIILLERIRAIKQKIPILIYSARGDINKYLINYKNIAYLQKPKKPELIIDEIKQLIRQAK
jgi:DNA-binding response OmpR family regulator